ncbi:protein yellow-like [Cloeon dipterum]|uniref:protein yellow-like n=1 Tax=Cloeon dipterum TaxID=197152 RepID=UPI00322072AA
MSAFVAAIFLLGLCLANAVNFTTVYEWEWDTFDFVWPSGADTSIGQIKDEYKPGNVYAAHMAVFGERLFLSLDANPGIPATLVWLPTSDTSTAPPKLAPFQSWHLHEKDNCDTIQVARGMDTDSDGRLWVLDEGNRNCPCKIWIFNLVNNDTTERVHQFPDSVVSHSYDKRYLRDIVLDKTLDDYLAYIADSQIEHFIVYNRKMDKSWSVKTPGRRWLSLALSPNREARQLLYLLEDMIPMNCIQCLSLS